MVKHLKFTRWPDHGTPHSSEQLLRFIRCLRGAHSRGPVTVHCSAGVGRAGVLVCTDVILGLIERDLSVSRQTAAPPTHPDSPGELCPSVPDSPGNCVCLSPTHLGNFVCRSLTSVRLSLTHPSVRLSLTDLSVCLSPIYLWDSV